jgi:hypothetical protein
MAAQKIVAQRARKRHGRARQVEEERLIASVPPFSANENTGLAPVFSHRLPAGGR